MSRTGSTKNLILKLVSKKEMTLSDISGELGLAPSTVSQHLSELERDGAISQVDNPHIRKWKYYRLNNDTNIVSSGGKMNNNRVIWYGAIAIIIAAVAIIALSTSYAKSVGLQGYINVPLSLTDPPHVPVGTTALIINYSSAQVHLSNAGNSSGWLSSNAAGTINLMTLLNVSQTIGGVSVPANATVNMVRFQINSASITINGTVYNVTVPSSQVTAHLEGSANSTVGILLDLSPTVATIFTQNSTIFVMVPSLRAVVVGQANTTVKVGERRNLSRNESDALEHAKLMISIANASFNVNGNATSLSVTVTNNANSSVVIKHILVFGNESVTIATAAEIHANVSANATARSNVSIQAQKRPVLSAQLEGGGSNGSSSNSGEGNSQATINTNVGSDSSISVSTNASGQAAESSDGNKTAISINASSESQTHISTNGSSENHVNESSANRTESGHSNETSSRNETEQEHSGENHMNTTIIARTIQDLRTINFLVQSNSTSLALPFSEGEFSGEGYSLAPGASVTFTFIGNISTGGSQVRIKPIAGDMYKIEAIGEESAFASLNVTARS